jgi:N-acetylneuraminic acid mutarotase
MKTTSLLVVLLLSAGAASVAVAQTPAFAHNTWTTGAPMPTPQTTSQVGVIGGRIYVVGGLSCYSCPPLAITQIYDPATDTWSTGVPLPIATCCGTAAVVKSVLYVIGGSQGLITNTNTVWAYSPKTKTWSQKSPMPTARGSAEAAVENNIIYVIGGNGDNGNYRLNTVESYNPATDTWTEEVPLLVGKSEPSIGRVGTTIVAADGYTLYGDTGDNEGYDATTNVWTSLTPDPTPRNGACGGAIGAKMYVAGGYKGYWPAISLTESFSPSEDTWKTIASMPQATLFPGSVVYKGRLYCFGGFVQQGGLNNAQIYQP